MAIGKDRLHGMLDALVLRALAFGPGHGYALQQWIAEHTRHRLELSEGSLYPALHRMKCDGWIAAECEASTLGRRARVSRITEKGGG